MESNKMKHSQVQIKEYVVIIIRNFEMVWEVPRVSGPLPVTNRWQNLTHRMSSGDNATVLL